MLNKIIEAYQYQQYADDDNIRAFFDAYNNQAQAIYDWMKGANLPIFIGGFNSGSQLNWIAYGIYGQTPPSMVSSKSVTYGPYNTIYFNQLAYNKRKKISTNSQIVASDDVFKRIMTWNFYKGDGFNFTTTWLKRRVRRFLEGSLGTDVVNDQQWGISVSYTGDGGIEIDLSPPDSGDGYVDLSFASILQSAFNNELLHMPFWASVNVTLE